MPKSKKIRGDQVRFHERKVARKSQLKAAAAQRLVDARVLPEADRCVGAMYLAGFALECALKCAICEKKGVRKLQDRHPEFVSARGHGRQLLLDHSGLEGRMLPGLHEDFVKIRSWNVGVRYNSATGNHKDAKAFVDRCDCVKEWIEEVVV